jgi:hypothetical protein
LGVKRIVVSRRWQNGLSWIEKIDGPELGECKGQGLALYKLRIARSSWKARISIDLTVCSPVQSKPRMHCAKTIAGLMPVHSNAMARLEPAGCYKKYLAARTLLPMRTLLAIR